MHYKVKAASILSFVIFLFIVGKLIIVNDLKIINPYSPTNRLISWGIIMPLTIAGIVISINVFKKSYSYQETGKER